MTALQLGITDAVQSLPQGRHGYECKLSANLAPVTRTSCVMPEAVPATSVHPSTVRSGTAFRNRLYAHTPAHTEAEAV